MKDIDTETTVVWPSWCYSDDIFKQLLKPSSDIAKDSLVCEPEIVVLPSIIIDARLRRSTDTYDSSSGNHIESRIWQNKSHTRLAIGDKMISERSLLLSGYNNTSIDNVKKNCEQTKTPPPPALSAAQAAALTVTPTTTAAAAAAYLYLEKVKNERMSPRVSAAQIDSLKDAIMESSAAAAAVAAAMVNNNNCSSSINNNNNNVNSCGSNNSNLVLSQNQIDNSHNNTSDELHSHSLPSSAGSQQQHLQSSSIHLNTNHVKRERLSPTGTNGDLQSALSRSRSTTPSSFRGTSPQHSVHSSPSETVVPLHNLSTNLLNSIQQAASSSARHNSINFSSGAINNPTSGLPSDFSTRNYSDFMRSLAAKYNNTNPTDSSNSRRQVFFDATANNATKKTTSTTTKTSYRAHSPSSTSISKEVSITTTSSLAPPPPQSSGAISPSESALSHTQQSQMAAAAVASAAAANAASGGSVSPFMTSFLSSLPFAQGIFPPLIDMSSTQALITLARAAKETEMHNILQMTQNSKSSTTDVSSTPSPSLNVALQQAAQFISPALIYSAQVQKQQLVSRQSSPRSTNITNSSPSSANAALSKNVGDKRNASPLDLSSQPPASKRFKAESTSSQSSTDGLLDATIKRRTSTSTATTSPSPPPLNDTSSSPVAPATDEATATAAFTPLIVGGSTSTTSSAYGGISTRQCQAHSEEVNSWTVQDVCAFVGSIDICTEYVKHFRDQCIDGSGLPLLTEDHLVNSLGMKLGPALKLRSMLAKKLGGPCPCVACVAQTQQLLALQTGAVVNPASTGSSSVAFNATPSAPENSGNCHSYRPNATATLCIAGAASTSNGGTNCGSNNNINSTNKSDSTSMASANSSNVSVPANNGIEDCGGSSITAGNNNCNINVATFPPPTYSNCCSSNYSASSKSSASNRDETGGSSSNSS